MTPTDLLSLPAPAVTREQIKATFQEAVGKGLPQGRSATECCIDAAVALLSGATVAVDRETKALADIVAERARQVSAEGWTPEHDDEHNLGELALAAGSYAINAGGRVDVKRSVHPDDNKSPDPQWVPRSWPPLWSSAWWKPKDPRRDLVRAGALIVAEIERLDRAASTKGEG